MLGGMLAPSHGKVWLDGQSLYDVATSQRASIRQRKLGFVFQTFNLIPYLSALENVEVPLMLASSRSPEQEKRAERLLARVGLESRLRHKPSELSIGQQQRVALARTLANDPAAILADEPTGNLDPQTREQVLEFFEELCCEGRTVIMVTHDPVAAERATRTIELADGAIVSDSGMVVHEAA
jgi:putative ABC transport system ATP-binding protein